MLKIDTTILIPFVLVGESTVEGFIKAEITQRSVDLSYSLAKDYKAYEFKQDNSRTSSTTFAYLNILLNKVVFGVNNYTITDPRLFSTDTGHVNTHNIHINDMNITFSTENTYRYITLCGSTTTQYGFCGTPDFCRRNGGCDAGNCPTGQCYFYYTTSTTCISTLIPLPDPMQGGGGTGGYGNTGEIPHAFPCTTPDNPTDPYTAQSNVVDPGNCPPPTGGPGWVPIEDDPPYIDVISDPNAPSYPDISDNEPQISLQSLFNCFSQVPDAGATYSVKLCVDLPVNAVWNAPFNLTHKSPGHTFLTLTKTNCTQSISQTVGFYPIGSGGNPINPNATGGFKNNGDPPHQYNAAINAYNVTASQFSMVMNNLLSHENDTYNIYDNNCTTIALNAFNLLIHPKIMVEPFVVQVPTTPPQPPYFFMQSPQKLYKAIETFQAGFGLSKEFNVNSDSPLSNTCP